MCLLVLFFKEIPGYPLVLCANRDEYYDRPSTPPEPWEGAAGDSPFLAPRDDRAGGTWIGLNGAGGVGAITNRKTGSLAEDGPSRGLLCAHALARGRALAMAEAARKMAGQGRYNGFNLLAADPDHAVLIVGGGRETRQVILDPGMHLLTNEHDLGHLSIPWLNPWDKAPPSPDRLREELCALLMNHDPIAEDGFSPCKHLGNRGTRSATVIALGQGRVHYLFADGAPCRTAFVDYSRAGQALMDREAGQG
jgi:uncharacterized protein with NRDE domain